MRSLSCVRFLATLWTAAYQTPLSMEFSRQEYCSGVPLPSPQEARRSIQISLPNRTKRTPPRASCLHKKSHSGLGYLWAENPRGRPRTSSRILRSLSTAAYPQSSVSPCRGSATTLGRVGRIHFCKIQRLSLGEGRGGVLSEQGCLSTAAAAPWFGVSRRDHQFPSTVETPGSCTFAPWRQTESSADLSTNISPHLHLGLRVFDRI